MGIPFWVPPQRRQRHNRCLCGFEFFLHIFTKSSSASVCPDISVGTIAITIIISVSNIIVTVIIISILFVLGISNGTILTNIIMSTIITINTIIFC